MSGSLVQVYHILPRQQRESNPQNLYQHQKSFIGNRFGTSEIPDNILEAIARTMLPDIREFFLSKEGQDEFAAWKAEYEKNRKKRT